MSYSVHLDEYTDDTIFKEAVRRRNCKRGHECYYCGKRLDSGHPCNLNEHNTPVPSVVAQEAVLQILAQEIERRLPSRRGFVLLVACFGEEGVDASDKSLASYVSSMDAADVPEFLEGAAGYIRNRETSKEEPYMSQFVVTYTHPDQDMHIRAANKIGREPDSRPDPDTSVWDFGEDELPATQAEARLRGDQAEITCQKREAEVSSGGLPEGGVAGPGDDESAASSPAHEPEPVRAQEQTADTDAPASAPPQGGGTPLNP